VTGVLRLGLEGQVLGLGLVPSGVAGPLAARGGGQICRPFVLGFGNWRAKDPML